MNPRKKKYYALLAKAAKAAPKAEPIIEAPEPKVELESAPVVEAAPPVEPAIKSWLDEKPVEEEKPKKKRKRTYTPRVKKTKPSDD